MNRKLWFKAKNYGWGWYPVSWQGWAVIALYVLGVLSVSSYLGPVAETRPFGVLFFFPPVIVLTAFLIVISYITGEKPEWRWGGKKEEMIDVLDEFGNNLGKTVSRKKIHVEGIWHRAVHVYIVDSKNRVLLQLRVPSCPAYGNMWHLSSGGHVESGQSLIESAIRETEEELGLTLSKSDFTYIGSAPNPTVFDNGKYVNNQIDEIFIARKDVDIAKLKKQESEVSDIAWFDIEELKQKIAAKDPSVVMYPGFTLFFAYMDNASGKN